MDGAMQQAAQLGRQENVEGVGMVEPRKLSCKLFQHREHRATEGTEVKL
jgi:hypothetical protein